MSEMIMQRTADNLARLRLSKMQEILPVIAEEAKKKEFSYLSFLDRLLEEEVAAKEDRRVSTSLKIAGLPFEKDHRGVRLYLQCKSRPASGDGPVRPGLPCQSRERDLPGASRCGQDPPGHRPCHQGLLLRGQHLLHHHGRPAGQTPQGRRLSPQGPGPQLLQKRPGDR